MDRLLPARAPFAGSCIGSSRSIWFAGWRDGHQDRGYGQKDCNEIEQEGNGGGKPNCDVVHPAQEETFGKDHLSIGQPGEEGGDMAMPRAAPSEEDIL